MLFVCAALHRWNLCCIQTFKLTLSNRWKDGIKCYRYGYEQVHIILFIFLVVDVLRLKNIFRLFIK